MDISTTIKQCRADPGMLYELQPAVFEAVVAELLASFGWSVSLTPPSRDGGYDVLGVTTDPSGLQTSWVVECKRYSAANKVGVEIVRGLVGVRHHIGVPNAVVVTTSDFTAGAREIAAARQDVTLVSRVDLLAWINAYEDVAGTPFLETQAFESCFVSHSSHDADFAQRLAGQLRRAGVNVWYAPEDIEPGAKIYTQVKKAIGTFDRLLVVISRHSMSSQWVLTELTAALGRERREGKRVLFPVAVVPFPEIQAWEAVDPDTGVDIARELRGYHIPDFTDWKNPQSFDEELGRVVQALRAKPSDLGTEPGLSSAKIEIDFGRLGVWRYDQILLLNSGSADAIDLQVTVDGQPMSAVDLFVSGETPPPRLRPSEQVGLKIGVSMDSPERIDVAVSWKDPLGRSGTAQRLIQIV